VFDSPCINQKTHNKQTDEYPPLSWSLVDIFPFLGLCVVLWWGVCVF